MKLIIDDSGSEWISLRFNVEKRKHRSITLTPASLFISHWKLIFILTIVSCFFLVLSIFTEKNTSIALVMLACALNLFFAWKIPTNTIKDIQIIDVKVVPFQLRICLYMLAIMGLFAILKIISDFISR